MLKNNAVYETEITDYTADGMGIAHADGCAVFIPNAIAGERVRISIVHAGKNKAIGKIEDILERSPHCCRMAMVGERIRQGAPTRRISSRPRTVLPLPGAATMLMWPSRRYS